MQTLEEEKNLGQTIEEEQVKLSSGHEWMPRSLVTQGDIKEMKGLWEQLVFEKVEGHDIPDDAKFVDSRLLRRIKGDLVKSRLVLRDIAKDKPVGGELFAATPTLSAFRLLLVGASRRMQQAQREQTENVMVRVLDVTQAFPHALIDQPVYSVLPADLDQLSFELDSVEKVTLSGGEYVRVLRALYGYRKSSQLWQRHFTKVIDRIGGVRCQSEPTMFRDRARNLVILVHVDDILMSGPVSEVESFSKQLKAEVRDSA